MDKAKVHGFDPCSLFVVVEKLLDGGCAQTPLVSTRPNGVVQTFCGYQCLCGTCEFRPSLILILLLQRAHDLEYAAMMDAQSEAQGEGQGKVSQVILVVRVSFICLTCLLNSNQSTHFGKSEKDDDSD